MTDTFDYSGLAAHVRAIALPHHASDVLRTRIEAAFVPRDVHDRIVENTMGHAVNEHARAEAAEAENARLREMFTQLRDCNWVITQPDLMDAVRDFACAALGGEHE